MTRNAYREARMAAVSSPKGPQRAGDQEAAGAVIRYSEGGPVNIVRRDFLKLAGALTFTLAAEKSGPKPPRWRLTGWGKPRPRLSS